MKTTIEVSYEDWNSNNQTSKFVFLLETENSIEEGLNLIAEFYHCSYDEEPNFKSIPKNLIIEEETPDDFWYAGGFSTLENLKIKINGVETPDLEKKFREMVEIAEEKLYSS